MQDEKFKTWLTVEKKYLKKTVQNRISNCRNVEKHHRDLDIEYGLDKGVSIVEKFCYSKEDFLENAETRHKVPINGNIRTGTATLKQSVKLYMEFCSSI